MNAMETPRMAVAIVSFNTKRFLKRCLECVVAARPTAIVVVDNGSTDGSVKLVHEEFPQVRLIVNDENRGYGTAANQALAACNASAVLLLNSDAFLTADALDILGRYLAEHPRAAVVGPRLENPDGTLQRSTYSFPSAVDTFFGESGLHLAVRRIPFLRDRFLRTWEHDRERPVPWVLGAALAIRRSVFEAVGGFDERFFMYGEEVDLCRRLADAGFETHFVPLTSVVHYGGATTRRNAAVMRREFIVSKRRYLLHHEARPAARRLLIVLRAITAARLARAWIRLRFARNHDQRAQRAHTVAEYQSLLGEHALWRP
jgi:N-acetylglucosaminyl-diphospho-decaprenol L-rhamnosyltransferase